MLDLMTALHTAVSGESTITDLVSTRIWVNQIPETVIEAQDTFHPNKMLVLRQAGGFGQSDLLAVRYQTITALVYGETDYDANRVLLAVDQFFTRTLLRQTFDSVLIHHINPTGGPIPSVEAELVWPAIAQSFSVYADVLEAA